MSPMLKINSWNWLKPRLVFLFSCSVSLALFLLLEFTRRAIMSRWSASSPFLLQRCFFYLDFFVSVRFALWKWRILHTDIQYVCYLSEKLGVIIDFSFYLLVYFVRSDHGYTKCYLLLSFDSMRLLLFCKSAAKQTKLDGIRVDSDFNHYAYTFLVYVCSCCFYAIFLVAFLFWHFTFRIWLW